MMTIYTYGACVRNSEGGSDFFVVNATSADEAKEIVEEHIEGDPAYPQGTDQLIWIQPITELLHQQFRGVAMLGGC